MKILITGGTGLLGRHLVWRFAELGHEVVFTGRDQAQAEQIIRLAPAVASGTMHFRFLAHGAPEAEILLHEYAAEAQAIVHCAGLASPWGTKEAFHAANVASTQEVLAVCRKRNIGKLVHISTPSIYFSFSDRTDIREDDPLPLPVNEYARTKLQAERLVLEENLQQSIILRPRAIFGPWDNTLLPRLLRIVQTGRAPLLRGGKALLDMSYVGNVVDAVLLGLREGCPSGTYNISNGEPIEVGQLFTKLAQAFDLPIRTVHRPYVIADLVARGLEAWARLAHQGEPLVTRYSLGAIAFSQTLSLKRATSELGYVPRISLDEAITRTATWWKEAQS